MHCLKWVLPLASRSLTFQSDPEAYYFWSMPMRKVMTTLFRSLSRIGSGLWGMSPHRTQRALPLRQ
jgi:hypothetical protein